MTGYCIGGLLAVRTAVAHPERVAAVAAFHAPVGADGPDALAGLTMADTDAFDAAGLARHWERLLPLLRGVSAEG